MASNSDYTHTLARSVNDMRKEKQLCDVVINVSGTQFPAHKVILVASSDYFRAMFTHEFKESTEAEVKIQVGTPEAFEVLLDYAYTGVLKVTSTLALEIMEMACFLQFTGVNEKCCEVINLQESCSGEEKISIENAFKLYNLAHMHPDLRKVEVIAMKTLSVRFQEFQKWENLLNDVSHTFLLEYLKHEDLANREEEVQVLEMVIAWIKHDWENRQMHAASLLKEVRLGLVPESNLKELLHGDIIEIPECKKLYEKVLLALQSEDSPSKRASTQPHFFATRSTITAPVILSAEDKPKGEDRCVHKTFHFQYFNADGKEWKKLPRFPTPQYLASLIAVEHNLYALAGYYNEGEFIDGVPVMAYKECYMFDPDTNTWKTLPPMIREHEVTYLKLVYADGYIYVIGGEMYDLHLVERFDLVEQKWEEIPSPFSNRSEKRWSNPLVYNGSIVIFVVEDTGHDQLENRQPRRHHMLAYHPSTNSWQTIYCEMSSTFEGFVFLEPVLFEFQGNIYRILYKPPNTEGFNYSQPNPVVNMLHFSSLSDGKIQVSVGKQIPQDGIPMIDNKTGAFRIGDNVFVNARGFVFCTDLKAQAAQSLESNLTDWEKFALKWEDLHQIDLLINSNVTYFTFDKKKFIDY